MSDLVGSVLARQSGVLARSSSGVGRDRKEDRLDRDKMLDVTLQQIEKQHGKGAVMKLGEHPIAEGIGTIPTGSLALDASGTSWASRRCRPVRWSQRTTVWPTATWAR